MEPSSLIKSSGTPGNTVMEQEQSLDEQVKDLSKQIVEALEDKGIWKMKPERFHQVVYFRVKNLFKLKYVSFYYCKRQAIEDLASLRQNGYVVDGYDYLQLGSSYFPDLLFSKTNFISGCHPKLSTIIGNYNQTLSMKNRLYQRLVYKMCSLTAKRICIINFKIGLKHVAKIINCGRRCKDIYFHHLRINFQEFPKNFLDYNSPVQILSKGIQLQTIQFQNCETNPKDDIEAYKKMICTIMRAIIDSQLVRTLKTVDFCSLPEDNSWCEVSRMLEYDNVIVSKRLGSTKVKFKFN
ncbi:unnamed protein product [Moneuplotes crassus]|uniref:Uncharacterized protein n=1 Tax=Euplotes crassus TaxID=5936 RepID=A0AAD2D1S7_EUPCR|nr:unnamed protein product [Moneuplotes crassus]